MPTAILADASSFHRLLKVLVSFENFICQLPFQGFSLQRCLQICYWWKQTNDIGMKDLFQVVECIYFYNKKVNNSTFQLRWFPVLDMVFPLLIPRQELLFALFKVLIPLFRGQVLELIYPMEGSGGRILLHPLVNIVVIIMKRAIMIVELPRIGSERVYSDEIL